VPELPRAPRTSLLAISSLVLSVLFLPLGASAFFGAGCTRGCEAGGAIYVRPGEEMPREVAPLVTRLAAVTTAGPELGALLLARIARRRIKRSGGRLGGAEVAAIATFVSVFALLLFVPVFACGSQIFGSG
jgi:hypothetical protein